MRRGETAGPGPGNLSRLVRGRRPLRFGSGDGRPPARSSPPDALRLDGNQGHQVRRPRRAGPRRENGRGRRAAGPHVREARGGASLLETAGGFDLFQIGTRNAETARTMLDELSIPVVSAETGGHVGRVVRFHVGTGRVTVRVIGQREREL